MEKKLNIFILGNSLTESILIWKLRKSPLVEKIYCFPGNISLKEYCEPAEIEGEGHLQLLKFAEQKNIDFVFIGSYKFIFGGLPDLLREHNIKVITSKEAKNEILNHRMVLRELLSHYSLSTPSCRVFENFGEALSYLEEQTFPLVEKIDNPAMPATAFCRNKEE